jgi:hypothetical protein
MVYINWLTDTAPELPFGGVKRSGYGRELSDLGIKEFVNQKLVVVLVKKPAIGRFFCVHCLSQPPQLSKVSRDIHSRLQPYSILFPFCPFF